MSHFTQMTTKMTNLERLVQAARRRNFEVIESEAGVPLLAQGFMENQTEALAVIKTGSRYDIAVQRNAEGNLELVADWELLSKVTDLNSDSLAKSLRQEYAQVTVEELAAEQGLSITEVCQ